MSKMKSVSWQQSKVQMTQIVLPSHTNNHGTAFGGQIAAWCDICAAVSAQRFCRAPVVTASMDELHFGSPIKRGMVVILDANVNRAWRSSMEVGVRVTTEDPITGVRALCCEAFLTFVAINDGGSPISVPTLDIESDSDAQVRFGEAQARRDARLAARAKRSVV